MSQTISKVHIITPVKDAIDLTLQTAQAVLASEGLPPFRYTVYDDFSTTENAARLDKAAAELGFEVIHLSDLTTQPSPNYLLVLQRAQAEAKAEGAALIIVESDVVVKADTLAALIQGATFLPRCGMAAAVTCDERGEVNYPYLYAKGRGCDVREETKHLSFCCTLLTPDYLAAFDFQTLSPEKNWHDVTISHKSLELGFKNYLFNALPVWHRPHSSRPWKHLKYSNPLKYYWRKLTKGLDKI